MDCTVYLGQAERERECRRELVPTPPSLTLLFTRLAVTTHNSLAGVWPTADTDRQTRLSAVHLINFTTMSISQLFLIKLAFRCKLFTPGGILRLGSL